MRRRNASNSSSSNTPKFNRKRSVSSRSPSILSKPSSTSTTKTRTEFHAQNTVNGRDTNNSLKRGTSSRSSRNNKLVSLAHSSSSSSSTSSGGWSDDESTEEEEEEEERFHYTNDRTLTTTTTIISTGGNGDKHYPSSSSALLVHSSAPQNLANGTFSGPTALDPTLSLLSSSSSPTSSADQQGGLLLEQPTTKRWRDWWLRFSMTLLMISGCFAYIFITKQPGVVLMVFVLQGLIYRELITIALNDSKERDMPGFRFFYYYWFFVYAYFMYIRTTYKYILSGIRGIPVDDVLDNSSTPPPLVPVVSSLSSSVSNTTTIISETENNNNLSFSSTSGIIIDNNLNATITENIITNTNSESPWILRVIEYVVTRYEPITFVLFIIGFVAFVISLRQRRNFRYQFSQLAYCHMALLLVVVQSTYLAANVFHGLLWFFLPCGLVVANDSFAYVAGFFFGRTPLIRLSPKKTVEGFIGGGIATVFYALISTHLYTTLEWGDTNYLMACPVDNGIGWQINRCDIDMQTSQLYKPYPLQDWSFGHLFPVYFQNNFYLSRMQVHAVALSLFASVVAPFGGFFASGFKRAFKIKDFGTSIPGHGGFTDRMDCQLIMATFAYIYGLYVLDLGQSTELIPHYLAFLKRHLNEDDLKLLYNALGQYLLALPPQNNPPTGTAA